MLLYFFEKGENGTKDVFERLSIKRSNRFQSFNAFLLIETGSGLKKTCFIYLIVYFG